jgi:uncharacterized protein (DUF2141 family)
MRDTETVDIPGAELREGDVVVASVFDDVSGFPKSRVLPALLVRKITSSILDNYWEVIGSDGQHLAYTFNMGHYVILPRDVP